MDLRAKHEALLALRPFVRTLPAAQIPMFHQIAARYAGPADDFSESVIAEFQKTIANPGIDELEIRLSVIRALGGGAPVQETIDGVKAVWPQLSPTCREYIHSDVSFAIEDGNVGEGDLPAWNELVALAMTTNVKRQTLEGMRLAVAKTAFEAYEFGCLVLPDKAPWKQSVDGRTWRLPLLVAEDGPGDMFQDGIFVVSFEHLTCDVKEAYGMLNGRILRPAEASLAI